MQPSTFLTQCQPISIIIISTSFGALQWFLFTEVSIQLSLVSVDDGYVNVSDDYAAGVNDDYDDDNNTNYCYNRTKLINL